MSIYTICNSAAARAVKAYQHKMLLLLTTKRYVGSPPKPHEEPSCPYLSITLTT